MKKKALITGFKISLVLIFILSSCDIYETSKLKHNDDNMNIIFSSVYENEKISIKMNDSLFLINKLIKTDRSLGVDRNNYLEIKADTIILNVVVEGSLNVIDKTFSRELKLDTILFRKRGSYVWLEVRDKLIKIKQQKNKFVLE